MGKIKVALYPRVSSQEQATEGYSIGEQIERLTKYCEAMGWDIYKIYTDPGYSGGNTDRPGLQTMLSDVRDGKVDKVVVYKLDRLSRSQKDTMLLIEDEFLAHGVDFVSMSENFDTATPFGRAMIGILAVFAQLERENIKERTMIGKEARAKEGKWGGGSSKPIGYRYNVAKDLLEVDDYEAMQIREAIDLFLKGTPLRTIETIFREKGYTFIGRSGKPSSWDPKRFRYVFSSKTYLGYIKYHDQWYKGEHEPIIDEETFNKLQKLLNQRAEDYKQTGLKPGAQTTYLGGLLYCKHCGGKYHKTMGGSKKYGRLYYYMCYSRSKKVKKMVKDPNCKNKGWRIEVLESMIFDEIKKLSIDPDYIGKLKKDKKDRLDSEPNKIEILEKEIKSIDDQISRFMDLYGIGKFTIDQVSDKVDPLNEKRNALAHELDKLNSESGKLSEEEALDIVNSFEDILERGEFNEIRLTIESLIYYIELDNEDVIIHWKFE